MTTTTATPASSTHLRVRSVELKVQGRDGTVCAYDWFGADCELRGLSVSGAPPAPGFVKVHANVAWRDGFLVTVPIEVYQGDDLIPDNLLVRALRREGLCYTGQAAPLGQTVEQWQAHLRETCRDLYGALVARWQTVLSRLPEKAPHGRVADAVVQEAVAVTVPSGTTAAANDTDAAVKATYAPPPDFVGSKFVRGRDKAETAKLIRAELKALGDKGTAEIPKGTAFRVTIDRFAGGSSIDVRVIPPADFLAVNVQRVKVDLGLEQYRDYQDGPPIPLFTPACSAMVAAAQAVLQSYNRDASDTMTDYFDVDFYGHAEMDGSFERAQRAIVEQTLRAVFPHAKGGAQ